MKEIHSKRILSVSLLLLFIYCSTTIYAQKVYKVLAIGNSFSVDAAEAYLDDLAAAKGIKLIIGNVYIGGCTLETHWKNASQNLPAYSYRKINEGDSTTIPDRTLLSCITDENWDFITFQQASPNSGDYNSFFPYLTNLIAYVKSNATNPDVMFALHQTWAYASNSTHPGFKNYKNNQDTMYHAIVAAIQRASIKAGIHIIIPSGTAIQNGRSSAIGDHFCRDGYHLSLDLGRYTAACTWFEMLFGKSVIGNTFAPKGMSKYEVTVAQKSAHFSVRKPNAVTQIK
ncbi:MAG: DUF4886 domain-containing protein [Paludibacter sp.]